MDVNSLREDLWREASEDRSRDEVVKKAVEAVAAGLEAVLREEAAEEARDAADVPWMWLERVVLLGGLVLSGWLSRGGLWRLWQRCHKSASGAAASSPPVLPLQHQAGPPPAPQQPVMLPPPPYHQAAAQLLQHQQQQPQHPDPAYWG